MTIYYYFKKNCQIVYLPVKFSLEWSGDENEFESHPTKEVLLF